MYFQYKNVQTYFRFFFLRTLTKFKFHFGSLHVAWLIIVVGALYYQDKGSENKKLQLRVEEMEKAVRDMEDKFQ